MADAPAPHSNDIEPGGAMPLAKLEQKVLCGQAEPILLGFVYGKLQAESSFAQLYFHEDQLFAIQADDINFSPGAAEVAFEQREPLAEQVVDRSVFAPAAYSSSMRHGCRRSERTGSKVRR